MTVLYRRESERSLLGCVILGGQAAFDRAAVEAADLSDFIHASIWRAMTGLRLDGKNPGDPVLLGEVLGDDAIAQMGGLGYLAELTAHADTDSVEDYSALIRRSALTRRVFEALASLRESPLEGPELLAEVLERVSRLARNVDDAGVTMADAVVEAFQELGAALDRVEEGGGAWGISTGYEDLDNLLGGVQRGVVTILAARPSMGKSALARRIGYHATKRGIGVHDFTPEDSRRTKALRQISDLARVPLERLFNLKLSASHLTSIGRAVDDLRRANLPWVIDDTAAPSAHEIAMRVRKRKGELNTGVVIVDYIQLLHEPDIPAKDPRLQIDTSTARLIQLARSEDVAVLLLSQLNRECEKDSNKRPKLHHLRESGGLEQNAHAVLFLYRDEVYNEDTEAKGICEVNVAKNKNGPTGTCKLRFDAPTATHQPLSTRDEPPL